VFHAVLLDSTYDEQINGWELFAGSLRFPRTVDSGLVPATDVFRVWGYGTRAQLLNDNDIAELDTTAEWAVRAYARATAFALLHADRALFKQWQAASQNSDVSMNQLNALSALYTSEWDHQQKRLRRLRR